MKKSSVLLFIIVMTILSYFIYPNENLKIQVAIYSVGYFIVKLLEEKL